MTTQQVAALLGITPGRVHALIRAGMLHPTKPAHDMVYDESEVHALKKRRDGQKRIPSGRIAGGRNPK